MSGRGEQPNEFEEPTDENTNISIGETLYTEDGTAVGRIRGVEEGGMFVSTREGVEALSIEHARSGHAFGEAELVWRCMDCGEMGHIRDELPDSCPGCGTEREKLMYWTED
jgi:rubrerythrin